MKNLSIEISFGYNTEEVEFFIYIIRMYGWDHLHGIPLRSIFMQ